MAYRGQESRYDRGRPRYEDRNSHSMYDERPRSHSQQRSHSPADSRQRYDPPGGQTRMLKTLPGRLEGVVTATMVQTITAEGGSPIDGPRARHGIEGGTGTGTVTVRAIGRRDTI
ncbi:hypothetical protein FQN49_007199 [Arthroderma sp. PD_2]|nr:hypothetical protein FQN49_007199 [Arthroderma sp. PD_2]